jgi:PilZ domain
MLHSLDQGLPPYPTAHETLECLLVSRDPSLVGVLSEMLEKLSVATDICFTASKAAERLTRRPAELLIVDWEEGAAELLRQIEESAEPRKPTVVAVSPFGDLIPGVYALIQKPVTGESCAPSLRLAYNRILREHRRHARYPLMLPLTATDQNHRLIAVTVANIGDGGVGLVAEDILSIGDVLSFRLLLPGTSQSIRAEARVQWTQKGRAGCEFVSIPPVELIVLHDWLKAQCKIRRPLVEV